MTPTEADGADPIDRALQQLTDEERRARAAEDRRQRHWLRQATREEGTFHGVLVDLAEREVAVVLSLGGDRRAVGRIDAVGEDVLVLTTTNGGRHLVALAHLESVRPEPLAHPPAGDREDTPSGRLVDQLGRLADERVEVTVATTSGEVWSGRIRQVGRDVLVLAVGADPAPIYVPLHHVGAVTTR